MKTACAQCPFREGSGYVYDGDAREALDDGNDPACHMQVGLDAIFAHAPFTPPAGMECAGHAAWIDGLVGYAEPKSPPPLPKEPA